MKTKEREREIERGRVERKREKVRVREGDIERGSERVRERERESKELLPDRVYVVRTN